MSQQTTDQVPPADEIDAAIAVHDMYVNCVAAAVKHPTSPRPAVLNALAAVGLDVDTRNALTVMAITTARYVQATAEQLGQHPALLWRRFATAESQLLRDAWWPVVPEPTPSRLNACDEDTDAEEPAP